MALPLYELLNIPRGVIAVIGAGGKSSLIYALSRQLPGKVIICSTYTYKPMPNTAFISISDLTPEKEKEYIGKLLIENPAVCTGQMTGFGTLSPSTLSYRELHALADYVLVEADRSCGFPIKMHDDDEPLLPEDPDCIIQVVGADGFMKPLDEATDNPRIFRLLTGCGEDSPSRPELVAKAFKNERLPLERPRSKSEHPFEKRIFLNKVEKKETLALAKRFSESCSISGVVAGSLKYNAYKLLN